MNARLIKPAVTIAMAEPLKMPGTSAPSRRSRMPANNTITRVKPSALPKPNHRDLRKVYYNSFCTISSGTPSTAQLVVMSGR